ncbi:twin-arginine translocase subunit TatC [Thermodesulfobacterium hydrogeniphilum]|uniref:twin-arginine translocase subunit TatC n=1 Tax=Thermodesulfobacterium hydrogeniphilum TaxID=161156 RepID=UPI00056E74CE|nr:twin-arginine translocase subunit TatC [Thermodesulfobacterium hydrogeniphilum]
MSKLNIPKIFAVDVLGRIRKEIIIYSFLFLFLWFFIFFTLPYVFPYLMLPYFKFLKGEPLVFTSLEEALFVLLRASFYMALIITFPFLLIRLWKAVSSEFYEPEKKLLKKIFTLSIFLGILGIIVGYFLFVPILLKIFLYFGKNFEANLKINYFLFFILRVILFSVIIFQMPLFLALLIKEEFITEEVYKKRRFYFLGFFYAMSVLLVPTDFFSQILLTLFFFLFFKLAFFLAKILK